MLKPPDPDSSSQHREIAAAILVGRRRHYVAAVWRVDDAPMTSPGHVR
jgi:hypothetical protein